MIFSNISYLNIPEKHPGSILRSYEYNDTVAKINELVSKDSELNDHLRYVPEYNYVSTDISSLVNAKGKGIVLHDDENSRLYPYTKSSYIITSDGTNIEQKIDNITLSAGNYIDISSNQIHVKSYELVKEFVDNDTIYVGDDQKIHVTSIFKTGTNTEPISEEFLNNLGIE